MVYKRHFDNAVSLVDTAEYIPQNTINKILDRLNNNMFKKIYYVVGYDPNKNNITRLSFKGNFNVESENAKAIVLEIKKDISYLYFTPCKQELLKGINVSPDLTYLLFDSEENFKEYRKNMLRKEFLIEKLIKLNTDLNQYDNEFLEKLFYVFNTKGAELNIKEFSVPPNCRQRLAKEGKPYPKSNCFACGLFSPKANECDKTLEKESKT